MSSPPEFRLVLHDSGLWEASVAVDGQEAHFGFFSERAEAQRTIDAALAGLSGETADADRS